MLENLQEIADTPEDAEKILRSVSERYRICNYLFRAGAVWLTAGLVCLVFAVLFGIDPETGRLVVRLFWLFEGIGLGIFSIALAMTFAIYRCPVCDCYLSRFRPDKLRCPNCSAQVRSVE